MHKVELHFGLANCKIAEPRDGVLVVTLQGLLLPQEACEIGPAVGRIALELGATSILYRLEHLGIAADMTEMQCQRLPKELRNLVVALVVNEENEPLLCQAAHRIGASGVMLRCFTQISHAETWLTGQARALARSMSLRARRGLPE